MSGVANAIVKEGSDVTKDQVVATITVPWQLLADNDDARALTRIARSVAEEEARGFVARKREVQSNRETLLEKNRQLVRDRVQIHSEIEVRRLQVANFERTQAKLDQLRDKQYASELQVSQHRDSLLEKMLALKQLERSLFALDSEITASMHQLDALDASALALDSDASEAELRNRQQLHEMKSREGIGIPSPTDGTVSAIAVAHGEPVVAGQFLASIVPSDTPLAVHLRADSRAIGAIAIGDNVLIRYDAFPYQRYGQFSGSVSSVSRSAMEKDSHDQEGGDYFRVVVTLAQTTSGAGAPVTILPGMTLEADILGETRSLLGWIIGNTAPAKNQVAGAEK